MITFERSHAMINAPPIVARDPAAFTLPIMKSKIALRARPRKISQRSRVYGCAVKSELHEIGKSRKRRLVTPIDDGALRRPGLQQVGRRRRSEHRSLVRGSSMGNAAVGVVEVTIFTQFLFVLVVVVVLALGTLIVVVEMVIAFS